MSLAELTVTERADLDAMPRAVGAVGDILYPALQAAGPLTATQTLAISEAAPELVLAIATVVRRRMPAQIREMCDSPVTSGPGELGPCQPCLDAADTVQALAEVLDETDTTLDAQLLDAIKVRGTFDAWSADAGLARFREAQRG